MKQLSLAFEADRIDDVVASLTAACRARGVALDGEGKALRFVFRRDEGWCRASVRRGATVRRRVFHGDDAAQVVARAAAWVLARVDELYGPAG